MRFPDVVATLLVAPLVAAHGAGPKIFGLAPRDVAMLKSRNILGGHHAHHARNSISHSSHKLDARQGGLNGRCGPENSGASCAEGYCCSAAGYCGQTTDYCAAPDGLFAYGPANDANVVPSGGSTRSIARPVLGNQNYGGEGIYSCLVPGTIAITYDDGPYSYTQSVIDQFNALGFKATFFITGRNIGKGSIDDTTTAWPQIIQNMYAGGHQIASHTWSHQDLSAITKEQRYEQMVKNEMAIANIIGKFPTYMRPPYSSCTAASGCEQDMADLGYVVSYFDLDTDDYNNLTPEKIQNAKNNFNNAVVGSDKTIKDFLAVAHDIHDLTANNLTVTMLQTLKDAGYTGVTMGECMGDPAANWYRDASPRVATTSSFSVPPTTTPSSSAVSSVSVSATATSSAPSSTATVSSQDGSCGGTTGYTCKGWAGGSCCSQYGWCGAADDYCGTGCNPLFGTCGVASSSSSSAAASSSAARSSSASSTVRSSFIASSTPVSSTVRSSSVVSSTIRTSSVASSTIRSSSVASSTVRPSSVASSTVRSSSVVSSTIRSSSIASNTVRSSSVASSTVRSSSVVSSTIRSSSVASSTVRSSSVASSTVRSSSAASSTVRSSTPVPSSTRASSTRASSTVRSSTIRTSSTRTSTAPSASATLKVSTDGVCGTSGSNQTCTGSIAGTCCSQYGWCGSTTAYCGTGCQKGFGTCT